MPLLLIGVLLVSCTESPQPSRESTYVHAMDGAPNSLDPGQATSIYANFLAVNLYDTLFRYRYLARPYELAPNLAEAVPAFSADGLELTVRIKQGVRFIDDPAFADGKGREVTVHDVVFSLLRHFDPTSRAQGAWLWQGRIEGLDEWRDAGADYAQPPSGLVALDDHTLRIRLTRPYPQLLHTLAQGYSAVVPREAVDTYGAGLGTRAVGSGPFMLERFDSARAVLHRNPTFRAEPIRLADEGFDPEQQAGLGLEAIEGRTAPLVDRVVVEFIAEDAARWNAFLSGDIDFLKVPVTQFDTVLDDAQTLTPAAGIARQYQFSAATESGFVYTNFNMSDPAIGDHPDPQQAVRNRALRCAITRGFDWQARNDRFYYGIARVFPGVIVPTVPEFDPQQPLDSIRHDPDAARALLAEHGWTAETLPVLEYGFPSSVTERQLFEQFRGFMTDIGWPADKIRPLSFATYGDYARAYSRREVMLMTSSWTMDYPDAENTMQLYYGPNAAPGSNSANFADTEYDRLYALSSSLPPSPERTRLYRAMNQRVIDECATISGLSRTLLFLWSRERIMQPDRSFVGGFFFRFVDVTPAAAP